MLKCYIIDDEPHCIDGVKRNIERIPGLHLIGSNTNPLIALSEIQKGNSPDLIFLDIEMPELSGIDLAMLLPKSSAIVITTAYVKHAYEAFNIDAVDFLFKPYRFERFVQAISKAEAYLQKRGLNNLLDLKGIFISSCTKGKINQVAFNQILYIEAIDHMLYIYTRSETFTTRTSLRDIEEKLPPTNFIRVHRSFIINIDFLESFDGTGIKMINNLFIPFGEMYKRSFKDKINL